MHGHRFGRGGCLRSRDGSPDMGKAVPVLRRQQRRPAAEAARNLRGPLRGDRGFDQRRRSAVCGAPTGGWLDPPDVGGCDHWALSPDPLAVRRGHPVVESEVRAGPYPRFGDAQETSDDGGVQIRRTVFAGFRVVRMAQVDAVVDAAAGARGQLVLAVFALPATVPPAGRRGNRFVGPYDPLDRGRGSTGDGSAPQWAQGGSAVAGRSSEDAVCRCARGVDDPPVGERPATGEPSRAYLPVPALVGWVGLRV